MPEIPRSVWQGSFRLLNVDIVCHVLDNGQRIIEKDSVQNLLTAMASQDKLDSDELAAFVQWFKAQG